jgi:hypothetical protein
MSENGLGIYELRDRAAQLRAIADQLDSSANQLEGVADDETLLGGRKLIEAAQDVVEPGEVVHYVTIANRLSRCGVFPRGKAPLNTLLAALNRSPYFSRDKPRSGEYRRHAPVPEARA